MSETEALDVVSQMVLAKIKTRPGLTTRWGQLLKMLYEECPNLRTPARVADKCCLCHENKGVAEICQSCLDDILV